MPLTVDPHNFEIPATVEGSAALSEVAGPFRPAVGVPIMLTLSGTWTGSVTVKRSVDGGATKLPLTEGGAAYGVFTANCNEPIAEESEGEARWYLDITRTTGTIVYRMAQ